MMPPRVFDPEEVLTFRFTAAETNLLIAIVDTTTGFAHRVTHPLWEKLVIQANQHPIGVGDGFDSNSPERRPDAG